MKIRLLVLIVVLVSVAVVALAEGDYLDAFMVKYSKADGSKFDTCNLCHVQGQPKSVLNPYGTDLKASGAESDINNALTVVEPMDSDGDGATNIAEILNDTWPGDPNDTTPVASTSWGSLKAKYE